MFVGTLELDISPSSHSALLGKFKKSISQIPGLEVLLLNDHPGERAKITVYIGKPIPLLRILKGMTLVSDAVQDKNNIKVELQSSERWVS